MVRMARKLRIQYSGAIYHCMSRGNHRADIFKSDDDRELFLDTLAEACKCRFSLSTLLVLTVDFSSSSRHRFLSRPPA
jgi:hypothetical protein